MARFKTKIYLHIEFVKGIAFSAPQVQVSLHNLGYVLLLIIIII